MGAQQPKSSNTDFVSFVCLAVLRALPLVVRFCPLNSPNPPKRTSPARSAWLCSLLSPFWPLSGPNPPKRTSKAWSAWLCSSGPRQLGLLGCGPVLAAQQPKSSKTDVVSFVCLAVLRALPLVVRFWPLSSPNPPKRTSRLVRLAVLLALPLVVRFGRSAAQILQNGPRQLGLLGCAPCSPSGGPFWPLSSPNPPKRTSPAWSAWLGSLLCSGGPFWPLSSPKRTSAAWSAWLCSLLSLW